MRKLEELCLEQIGDRLCIVFRGSDSRFRDILGSVDPNQLDRFAEATRQAALTYAPSQNPDFRVTLLE